MQAAEGGHVFGGSLGAAAKGVAQARMAFLSPRLGGMADLERGEFSPASLALKVCCEPMHSGPKALVQAGRRREIQMQRG